MKKLATVMNVRLDGRRALVTRGGFGVGAAIPLALAEAGAERGQLFDDHHGIAIAGRARNGVRLRSALTRKPQVSQSVFRFPLP